MYGHSPAICKALSSRNSPFDIAESPPPPLPDDAQTPEATVLRATYPGLRSSRSASPPPAPPAPRLFVRRRGDWWRWPVCVSQARNTCGDRQSKPSVRADPGDRWMLLQIQGVVFNFCVEGYCRDAVW